MRYKMFKRLVSNLGHEVKQGIFMGRDIIGVYEDNRQAVPVAAITNEDKNRLSINDDSEISDELFYILTLFANTPIKEREVEDFVRLYYQNLNGETIFIYTDINGDFREIEESVAQKMGINLDLASDVLEELPAHLKPINGQTHILKSE